MTIPTNNAVPIINPIYPSRGRRILLLSLEFNYSPFSGNGVLARSIVSSLIRRKDVGVVRVICAKPHASSSGFSKEIVCINNGCNDNDNDIADFEIWPVELPQHCQVCVLIVLHQNFAQHYSHIIPTMSYTSSSLNILVETVG